MSDRVSALNWVYENHRLQLKDLVRLNTKDPEMEEWLKKEIDAHQSAMVRVKAEIHEIAYPSAKAAQVGQINKEPSCPSDASKGRSTPLSNLDPKNYW